ncbi:hypothetical protein MMC30_002329 [Trapelia coarctata]|nr:hypothetical protein [Trapelia coarctata]
MAEPQPPMHAGSADLEDEHPPAPTGGAEDRKAAAALSSLSSLNDEASTPKGDVDQKALGDAISRLEVGKGKRGEEKGKKAVEGEKKKVKVDAGDVALLVEELELNKVKATELLRAHDGDALKAMRAFVRASA